MKKVIRLTESDLARIVKRVLMEQGPLGGKTPFDPESDIKYSEPVQNNSLDGFKLVDINFPKYGIAGELTGPTADKPKTLVGAITTPGEWLKKGQIKLSNGKTEIKFFGTEKKEGVIKSADKSCLGTLTGTKINNNCWVQIKLKDNTVYSCWNDMCKKES
jgi:hypothetical protein